MAATTQEDYKDAMKCFDEWALENSMVVMQSLEKKDKFLQELLKDILVYRYVL